jgi:uncharacterized protein
MKGHIPMLLSQNQMFTIEKIVKDACFSSTNKFGESIWQYHILPVKKHGILLANELSADKEIVELACLLHDYSSIKDYNLYPEHHIHSAKLASQLLLQYNYPASKIDLVCDCILEHRNSVEVPQSSIESICVASADAMSHITEALSLLYLAYSTKKLDIESGRLFLKNKLEKSWKKICPLGQKIIKEQYDAISLVLLKKD